MEKIRIRCGDKAIVLVDEAEAVTAIAEKLTELKSGDHIKIERIVVEEPKEENQESADGEGQSVEVEVEAVKMGAKQN